MCKLEEIKTYSKIVASIDFSIKEVSFFGVTNTEESWALLFASTLDEKLAHAIVSLAQQDCCIENNLVPGFLQLTFENNLIARSVIRDLWRSSEPHDAAPDYMKEIVEFYQQQIEEGNIEAEKDTADRFRILRLDQEEYLTFLKHINAKS